jgi:catechol 2,3-dioxygenase-like lactoylglutathione lyase family enzyme
MTIMPKLRHIAIATNDPKATAEFYKQAFGFEQVGETSPSSPLASGYFLSDGTLNIAVLKFKTDQIGKGMDFTGVHHFGVLVEDADKATKQLEALGAECFMGKDKGHGKGFFEIKFKGPDGTVFDIAEHPWMGSKPHDA